MGDYSYVMRESEIWAADIGRFVSIASHVRINANTHPVWPATQHHFTYRAADHFPDEANEESFFTWRRDQSVTVGQDVWIGHGATILPGVRVGKGAVMCAAAVVSKDVETYTIVGGVPARLIRSRFTQQAASAMDKLAWWGWARDHLHHAPVDFCALPAEDFVTKYI